MAAQSRSESKVASSPVFVTGPACPTCKRPAGSREDNRAFPFCSVRCRQVDLGRWLGEGYAIPDGAPSIEELLERKKG